jgi:hypothetical protein
MAGKSPSVKRYVVSLEPKGAQASGDDAAKRQAPGAGFYQSAHPLEDGRVASRRGLERRAHHEALEPIRVRKQLVEEGLVSRVKSMHIEPVAKATQSDTSDASQGF